MTSYQELRVYVESKKTASQSCGNRVLDSLDELLVSETGRVMTGMTTSRTISFRYGILDECIREVWTDEVSNVLTHHNIEHIKGYDTSKSGANGMYVQITSADFLKESNAQRINDFLNKKLAS
jgi:hypothetical protein